MSPVRYLLSALALELLFFALLQANWVKTALLVPFTHVQAAIALWYSGGPALPLTVTLSCSGADAIALGLGAILAYPAPWRRRLTGGAGLLAVVVPFNIARIVTLAFVGPASSWFTPLHLYVWPSILVAAVAACFLVWIRWSPAAGRSLLREWTPPGTLGRFAAAAAALLLAFGLLAPWIMSSATIALAGGWIARAAARMIAGLGVGASAAGNTLVTARGSFLVTQACIATPLVPVYLAGVLTAPIPRAARWVGVAVTIPLFAALGVLRLLALALPPALAAEPLFVAHGFYQFLVFAALVLGAAFWGLRASGAGAVRAQDAVRRTLAAIAAALAFALVAGSLYAGTLLFAARLVQRLLPWTLATLAAPGDAQGALHILPVYQASLLLALLWAAGLARRWTTLAAGAALVFASQILLLAALGGLHATLGLDVPVLLVRGWAVAAPPLVVLTIAGRRAPNAADVSELSDAAV